MKNQRLWMTVGALAVVMLIAIGFRFYDIKHYPPGLFPDEAANGEDVQLILSGDWRPFYPRGNGREGLFFFLQALSVKQFGIGVWPMHIVSAAVGTLTVLLIYFATQPYFGKLAGILAALFLATNHWHVTLSRTGFRAILAPLFLAAFTAGVGYTIIAVKKKQWLRSYLTAALAGAAFAGGFYTYIAYRAMVGVIVGVVVLLLLAALHEKIGFPHVRRYWPQLLFAIAAGLFVIAPLGWHFIQHPSEFVGRAGQVSVFNRELQQKYGGGTLIGTIEYSTRESVRAFFAGRGDLNWRHNVAGYPFLNPLVGFLFLLGLAWAIHGTVMIGWHILHGREIHLGMIYPYLLLLLLGMLVPVVTTAEGIPHGLRSLGLLVPIFMLAGTAGAVLWRWVQRRMKTPWGYAMSRGLIGAALVVAALYDGMLYFGIARHDSDAAYAYRGDLTVVSDYIRGFTHEHAGARPYLVLDGFSLQTPHYLLSVAAHEYVKEGESHPDEDKHLYRSVVPERSQFTKLQPGEIIIFTQSTLPDADRYAREHPETVMIESRRNQFHEELMRVYGLPDGQAPALTPTPVPVPQDTPFDLDA